MSRQIGRGLPPGVAPIFIVGSGAATLLAWSSNGQRIFAASHDNKISAFDTSTRTRLVESRILHDGSRRNAYSIALAGNGKYIATFAGHSILFLDTSTLTRIGMVNCHLTRQSLFATGRWDGKIIIRDLGKILPDSYGPFHVSICAFMLLACRISPVPSATFTKMHMYLLANNMNSL